MQKKILVECTIEIDDEYPELCHPRCPYGKDGSWCSLYGGGRSYNDIGDMVSGMNRLKSCLDAMERLDI